MTVATEFEISADLSTRYLGMKLKNPLGVAACSPLTGDLDMLRRLEDAGAAVLVLPSLFEEQIEHDESELNRLLDHQANFSAEASTNFPELEDYNTGPQAYLLHLEEARKAVSVPLIGSLNGSSPGGWVEYAKMIESAGADALELNIYFIPTDLKMTAEDVEQRYVDLVADVRQSIGIPLAVKIGQNFTSLPHFCQQLVAAGADGLVLFNRYLEPDIDLEGLRIQPDLVLSNPHEARAVIRWIAILKDQLKVSYAASSGIHSMEGAIKLLLAGADVTMMASVLMLKGPQFIETILREMAAWLEEHEYDSVEQMKGSMSRWHCPNSSALERANYMKTLTSYTMAHPTPRS